MLFLESNSLVLYRIADGILPPASDCHVPTARYLSACQIWFKHLQWSPELKQQI